MLKGFQVLKTRDAGDILHTGDYEKELGFLLPAMYKLFHQTFCTGAGSLEVNYYFNPKTNENYYASASYYAPLKDDEHWFLSIPYFETLDKVVSSHLGNYIDEEEWQTHKLLRIASIGKGGGLYVGTGPENTDVIYEVVWDEAEPIFRVADNIFELVKGFVLEDIKGPLQDGYDTSQLYKNYGDDVWRVRE